MPSFEWPRRSPPVRAGRTFACAAVGAALTTACQSAPAPRYPPFQGAETNEWLALDVPLPERPPEDMLPAFEESARSLGCSTEQLGTGAEQNIGRERRQWYGVSASCDEGTIALVTLVGGHVCIGCMKPTTRGRCNALLRQISEAR
jgi:hypothetical protein